MHRLLLLPLVIFLCSCSLSNYYAGTYNLYIDKNALNSKNEIKKQLEEIARANKFIYLSKNINDTLEFQGPPYHLIEFVFSENTNSDSLSFQFNYNGLLSTSSRANELHTRLKRAIDSTFKGKITYIPYK